MQVIHINCNMYSCNLCDMYTFWNLLNLSQTIATDNVMHFLNLIDTVPSPDARVYSHYMMEVGQSLTLVCRVITVRGINSEVSIVWSKINSGEVRRRSNISSFMTESYSIVYRDYFNISQLTTDDNDVTYECTVMINALESSSRLTLHLSGEH